MAKETRAAMQARIEASSATDRYMRELTLLLGSGLNLDGTVFRLPTDLLESVIVKPMAATAITAGTGATIWTPAAGKKFRLLAWVLSLSVAGQLIFGDNTVAAIINRSELLAAAGVSKVGKGELGQGLLSAVANNVLKLDVSVTGNVSGFVAGVEE